MIKDSTTTCVGFLKWPGGKRWAVPVLAPLVRAYLQRTYYEPFLGGAAVFFSLAPSGAMLSDINDELINVYRMAREHPKAIVSRLQQLPVSANEYERIRSLSNGSALDRAVRFLYLNRTCFGGVYRLNSQGRFNVPFGDGERTAAPLWQRGLVVQASKVLSDAELRVCDFQESLDRAGPGDVAYCDPTYTVAHDQNGFIRYNEKNFSWADQERLAAAIRRATSRGCTVLLSNAHHRSIRALFDAPRRWVLTRRSMVSASLAGRKRVKEYLFLWPGRRI